MKTSHAVLLLASLLVVLWAPTLLAQNDPFGGTDPFAKPPAKQGDQAKDKKDANAKPKQPTVKPAEEQQPALPKFDSLEQALDYLDSELDQREQALEFGSRQIMEIADELEAEYLRNDEVAQTPSQPDRQLLKRQRIILLQLSELRQLGRSQGRDKTVFKFVHEALQPFRKNRPPLPLMQRMAKVQLRAHKISSSQYGNRSTFSLIPPGETIQPPPNAPTNPFGASALDVNNQIRVEKDLRSPLGYLVKLRRDGDDLVLDREHWSAPFAGKTMPEIRKEVNELLAEYGIVIKQDDSSSRRFSSANKQQVQLLFENLESYAEKLSPSGGSSGGSGYNQIINKHFTRVGIEAKLRKEQSMFELSLRAGNDFIRVVESNRPDATVLRITMILDDQITTLERNDDGAVRLAGVKDDQAISVSANSFADLCAQHPREVEGHLYAELKRAGFVVPEESDR